MESGGSSMVGEYLAAMLTGACGMVSEELLLWEIEHNMGRSSGGWCVVKETATLGTIDQPSLQIRAFIKMHSKCISRLQNMDN